MSEMVAQFWPPNNIHTINQIFLEGLLLQSHSLCIGVGQVQGLYPGLTQCMVIWEAVEIPHTC